jgi:hypothetical protein
MLTADKIFAVASEHHDSGQRLRNSRHPGPQLSDHIHETPAPGHSSTSEPLKLPRSRCLTSSDRTQRRLAARILLPELGTGPAAGDHWSLPLTVDRSCEETGQSDDEILHAEPALRLTRSAR